jgi:nucleotide-binding universal stress UspA family protein
MVVGVDGSTEAARALDWALAEAKMRGSRLVVVRAWDYPVFAFGGGLAAAGVSREEFERAARESLDAVIDHLLTGEVAIERRCIHGPAAQALMAEAERVRASLLVVGSRGHGGFAGLLLGSVSATLAHHAPCPLVIIRREGRHG